MQDGPLGGTSTHQKELEKRISGEESIEKEKKAPLSEDEEKNLKEKRKKLQEAKQGSYGRQQTIKDLIEERRKRIIDQVDACTQQMPFLYKLGTKLGLISPKKFYVDQINKLSRSINGLETSLEHEMGLRDNFFKDKFKYEDLRNSAMYVIEHNKKKVKFLDTELSGKEVELESLEMVANGYIKKQSDTGNGKTREQYIDDITKHRTQIGMLEKEKDDLLADAKMYDTEYESAILQFSVSQETIQGLRELNLMCKTNRGQYQVAVKSINDGKREIGLIDNAEQAALINTKLDELFTNLYKQGVAMRPGQHLMDLNKHTEKTRIAKSQKGLESAGDFSSFETEYEVLKDKIKKEYKSRSTGVVKVVPIEKQATM